MMWAVGHYLQAGITPAKRESIADSVQCRGFYLLKNVLSALVPGVLTLASMTFHALPKSLLSSP